MGMKAESAVENVKNVNTEGDRSWRTKVPQFVAGVTAGAAAFMFGTVVGWLSPTLPLLQSPEPVVGETPITLEESSWLGSLMFLGALAASPLFSYICQNFGRKAGGYVTTVPIIISWTLILSGNSMSQLYVARFLAGVSTGGVIVFFPLYCGEIAEDSIRGTLGTFLSMFCNIGILFVYIIGPFVSFSLLATICLAIPFLFMLGFYWLPETPIYLVTKGKIREAECSLMWLRANKTQVVQEDLKKLKDLVEHQDATVSTRKSQKKILLSCGTRRAILIGFVVCIAQQFSGVYVVLNYCMEILEMSGSSLSPSIASIYVAILQVIGSVLSSYFVEVVGRKILLIGSEFAMSICLGTLGVYFHFQQTGADMTAVSYLPIICLSLYLFSAAAGLGPVTYVLISETFHPDIRGITTMIATSTIWLLAFTITKVYPFLVNFLGLAGCYWGFSGVCVACMLFAVFQVPETKNRSLDSILRELNGDKEDLNVSSQ